MIKKEKHKKILKISIIIILVNISFSVIFNNYPRMNQHSDILQHIFLAGGIAYYMQSESQITRIILINSMVITIIVVVSINTFLRITYPGSEISTVISLILFVITNNYLIITGVTTSISIFIIKKILLWKNNQLSE